jgi:hypothetical protein
VRKPAACWTRRRGLSNPHSLACRKRSCPALPTPAHKQFYSVNKCDKSMANWVYHYQWNESLHLTLLKQARVLGFVKCKLLPNVNPFYSNESWLCLKPSRKALQGRTACEKNGPTEPSDRRSAVGQSLRQKRPRPSSLRQGLARRLRAWSDLFL